MEELNQLLRKVTTINNDDDAERIFSEVAQELMSNYVIKKQDKQYRLLEIEFYWNSAQHPDVSTYRRKMKEGYWFLHPSGLDITFPSDEDAYGGILIRTIQSIDHPEEIYSGPWKCSDALFDFIPLDGAKSDIIPQLRKTVSPLFSGVPEQALRQGITKEHSEKYYTKGYCFYIKDPEWVKIKATNKPWNKRHSEYLEFKKGSDK
ncbi:MAG: hypothetical protein ACI4T9_08545 [Prevotella sp.]|jgi:hypothetical protein